MRKKKYLYDLAIQVLLIGVVIMLFKTNPSKVQASYWAGVLFVLMPLSMMSREWIFYKFTNKIWWAGVLQFWLLFALPILILRIQHPETSLNEVSVGPIPVSLWHKISNISYLLLMAVTAWSFWKYRKNEKA